MAWEHHYAAPTRWLHWIVALAVTAIVVLGLWMTIFEPADHAEKDRLYDLHQNLGITVLLLVALRLAARARYRSPPLPSDTPFAVFLASRLNHILIYALLLAQPVIGFLDTNAWGFPLTWWGLVPIPSPIGREEALAPELSTLHWYGALTLFVLLATHFAGVAYHSFIRRDRLLRRML
jgi:cytochrome b561